MNEPMNDLQSRLRGLWLPLVTPFRNGELDEASLRRLVRHYANSPIDGLVLAATTGESLTLTPEETERLVFAVRDELIAFSSEVGTGSREENASNEEGEPRFRFKGSGRKSLPLCLGLSGSNTRALLDTLDRTAGWPIDFYLISCPYYSQPSQHGLQLHFAALAERAVHPVMLYNIPYRTGVNLGNDAMLRLAVHPNIVGLKDCGNDRAQSIDFLHHRPPGFRVLTGEDARYYEALVDGADGGILAAAHIETETFARVGELLIAGECEAALSHWRLVADLARLLFAEPSPAPIKHWLWRTGLIDSAEVRLPMTQVSAELAERLDAEVRRSLEDHLG
jgi:4-hydroxy-tetrahydrodipicolinate synthase